MDTPITILFAFRNRDAKRIELSLRSLQSQSNQGFEVVFVDYGSQELYANTVKSVVESFAFASYHYVAHEGLLWNKSKALNYGIRQANTDRIVLADVDVLFTADFIDHISKLKTTAAFWLFKIGYLSRATSAQQLEQLQLSSIATTHVGDTFGIGLFSKNALEVVGGLDDFFHFYGSEDEDLNVRVQLAGFKLKRYNDVMLYHLWHPRYPQKKELVLQVQPRLTNVLRLNQRHFLDHKHREVVQPNPNTWGSCYLKPDLKPLEHPDTIIQLDNILAHVTHCFGEGLKDHSHEIVQVIVNEAPYFGSLKYRVKKFLGKETQPYMSMKAVNDLILKAIVFRYRDMNYSYLVSNDLKQIRFTIDFNTTTHDKI